MDIYVYIFHFIYIFHIFFQPGHPRHTHPAAMETVPMINCMELQLRFLSPADIDQVRL